MATTFKKYDSSVTIMEGKKVQVSIGNVREVRAKQIEYLAEELAQNALEISTASGEVHADSVPAMKGTSETLDLIIEKVNAKAEKLFQKKYKAYIKEQKRLAKEAK